MDTLHNFWRFHWDPQRSDLKTPGINLRTIQIKQYPEILETNWGNWSLYCLRGKTGILVPCQSPWKIPCLPMKEHGTSHFPESDFSREIYIYILLWTWKMHSLVSHWPSLLLNRQTQREGKAGNGPGVPEDLKFCQHCLMRDLRTEFLLFYQRFPGKTDYKRAAERLLKRVTNLGLQKSAEKAWFCTSESAYLDYQLRADKRNVSRRKISAIL